MAERSKDWYNQSQRDLASAKSQLKAEFFEWATFIAHQAAEKALKAVYQKFAAEAWGHSVNDLLTGLKEKVEVFENLLNKAKQLDKYYIPARYPNGWAKGFPAQYITRKDAEDAISDSEEILRFCEGLLAE